MIHIKHTHHNTTFGYIYMNDASSDRHIEIIKEIYPEHQWLHATQRHTNLIINTKEVQPDTIADGLWTDQTQHGLLIKTADCLPLLISTSNTLYALHAGWQGIRDGIVDHCINMIGSQPFTAWIGPHHRSYTRAVSDTTVPESYKTEIKGTECFINLATLVKNKLPNDSHVIDWGTCTYTDHTLPSYRRTQTKVSMYNYICRSL